MVGEVGSGGLSEGREMFLNNNESREVFVVAGDGGAVGRGG